MQRRKRVGRVASAAEGSVNMASGMTGQFNLYPLTEEEDKQRMSEVYDAYQYRRDEIEALDREREENKQLLKRKFDAATREQAKTRRDAARPLKQRKAELQAELRAIRNELSHLDFEFDQSTQDAYRARRDEENELHRDYCNRLFAIQDEQNALAQAVNERYRVMAANR